MTSGDEGGGEEAGDDVWTEIDGDMAGGVVYAGCCWLERRYLCLAWGLACWALRHIDEDLNLIVRVVCFCGIAGRGHATSLFACASSRCVYLASFPLTRQYMWRHNVCLRLPAHERAYGGVSSAM